MRGARLNLENQQAFSVADIKKPSSDEISKQLFGGTPCVQLNQKDWKDISAVTKEAYILQWKQLIVFFSKIVLKHLKINLNTARADSGYGAVSNHLIMGIADSVRDMNTGLFPRQQPFFFDHLKMHMQEICFFFHTQKKVTSLAINTLKDLYLNIIFCGPGLFGHIQKAVSGLYDSIGLAYWLADFRTLLVQQIGEAYIQHFSISDGNSMHVHNNFIRYADEFGWNLLRKQDFLNDFFSNTVSMTDDSLRLKDCFTKRYEKEAIAHVAACLRNFIVEQYALFSDSNQYLPPEKYMEFVYALSPVFVPIGMDPMSLITSKTQEDHQEVYCLNAHVLENSDALLMVGLHQQQLIHPEDVHRENISENTEHFYFKVSDRTFVCAHRIREMDQTRVVVPKDHVSILWNDVRRTIPEMIASMEEKIDVNQFGDFLYQTRNKDYRAIITVIDALKKTAAYENYHHMVALFAPELLNQDELKTRRMTLILAVPKNQFTLAHLCYAYALNPNDEDCVDCLQIALPHLSTLSSNIARHEMVNFPKQQEAFSEVLITLLPHIHQYRECYLYFALINIISECATNESWNRVFSSDAFSVRKFITQLFQTLVTCDTNPFLFSIARLVISHVPQSILETSEKCGDLVGTTLVHNYCLGVLEHPNACNLLSIFELMVTRVSKTAWTMPILTGNHKGTTPLQLICSALNKKSDLIYYVVKTNFFDFPIECWLVEHQVSRSSVLIKMLNAISKNSDNPLFIKLFSQMADRLPSRSAKNVLPAEKVLIYLLSSALEKLKIHYPVDEVTPCCSFFSPQPLAVIERWACALDNALKSNESDRVQKIYEALVKDEINSQETQALKIFQDHCLLNEDKKPNPLFFTSLNVQNRSVSLSNS